MIKLKDLLSEDIPFKHGNDTDRFIANSVVVFDPQDDYEIKGKTHGLVSHAIKHLHEFNPEYFNKIISAVRQIIEKSPNAILKDKSNKPITRVVGQTQYPFGVILNTMDFINDKVVNGIPLNTDEKAIKSYIDRTTDEYENIIRILVDKAIPVDNYNSPEKIKNILNQHGMISFYVMARGRMAYAYANHNNGIIVLREPGGKVLTSFKAYAKKEKINPPQRLKKYFSSSSADIINPAIKKALGID